MVLSFISVLFAHSLAPAAVLTPAPHLVPYCVTLLESNQNPPDPSDVDRALTLIIPWWTAAERVRNALPRSAGSAEAEHWRVPHSRDVALFDLENKKSGEDHKLVASLIGRLDHLTRSLTYDPGSLVRVTFTTGTEAITDELLRTVARAGELDELSISPEERSDRSELGPQILRPAVSPMIATFRSRNPIVRNFMLPDRFAVKLGRMPGDAFRRKLARGMATRYWGPYAEEFVALAEGYERRNRLPGRPTYARDYAAATIMVSLPTAEHAREIERGATPDPARLTHARWLFRRLRDQSYAKEFNPEPHVAYRIDQFISPPHDGAAETLVTIVRWSH